MITGAQIKNGSVSGKDIRDGSLAKRICRRPFASGSDVLDQLPGHRARRADKERKGRVAGRGPLDPLENVDPLVLPVPPGRKVQRASQGTKGEPGARGEKGEAGASVFAATIPSGTTVRGAWGYRVANQITNTHELVESSRSPLPRR